MKCQGCEKEIGNEVACTECSEALMREKCRKGCDWFRHDDNGVTLDMFEYSIDYCTFHHSDLDEMTKAWCHGFNTPQDTVQLSLL